MRDWIGKEVARYEHGARRLQLFFWAIIAINTFIDVVWGILPILYVLLLYMVGSLGVLSLGYLSHKAKVGRAITKTAFDIENLELWFMQQIFAWSFLELCRRMSTEKLMQNIQHYGKRLNVDMEELERVLTEVDV